MKKQFKKIYVEITNICNLKCSFCPDTKRTKEYMSLPLFEKIATQISPLTNIIALHVKGEPLMHPELKQILTICTQNNIKVNITTNGMLISNNLETILNSPSIRQLNISIHCLSENTLNNPEEYINTLFENIEQINQNTDIIISIRLWNLEDLKQNKKNTYILSKLEQKFNIPNLQEKAKIQKSLQLAEKIYLNQDTKFEWPTTKNEQSNTKGTCLGLREQIAILVNGDIVPCCLDQNGDIVLGNINQNTINEILQTKRSQDIKNGFQQNILIESLCQKCTFRKRF